jgi:hypothetical protein
MQSTVIPQPQTFVHYFAKIKPGQSITTAGYTRNRLILGRETAMEPHLDWEHTLLRDDITLQHIRKDRTTSDPIRLSSPHP